MTWRIPTEEELIPARSKLIATIARLPPLHINLAQHDQDTLSIISPLLKKAKQNVYFMRQGFNPRNPKKDVFKFPKSGLWFGKDDVDPIRGEVCAMCGSFGKLVNDHCHLTGLERGRLCASCNSQEGHNGFRPEWQLWQWAAPNLQLCNGPRYLYGGTFSARTQHEWIFDQFGIDRLHMPLSELMPLIRNFLHELELRRLDQDQPALDKFHAELFKVTPS